MLLSIRVVAIAASIISLLPATGFGQSTVPDIVRSAMASRSVETHGYFVYQRRRTQNVRYLSHSDTTVVDSSRAMDGVRVIGIRIRAESKSGTPADSAEIAKVQAKADSPPLMETDSDLPIAADRVGLFTFGMPQACDSCGADTVKVEFHSIKRGDGGTDGFLFIDQKNKHLVRVDYSPTTLAKSVTSATCTVLFGQVLPGVWTFEREEQHYIATRFFVKANIDISITAQQYRRYSSSIDALAALRE